MLDREFARNQVRRLSGLRSFPIEPEAIGELIESLRSAPTEDHAASFVARWLRSNIDAPRPAEVYASFEPSVAARDSSLRSEYACKECSDTGFVVVERGGSTGAEPCPRCRARV